MAEKNYTFLGIFVNAFSVNVSTLHANFHLMYGVEIGYSVRNLHDVSLLDFCSTFSRENSLLFCNHALSMLLVSGSKYISKQPFSRMKLKISDECLGNLLRIKPLPSKQTKFLLLIINYVICFIRGPRQFIFSQCGHASLKVGHP